MTTTKPAVPSARSSSPELASCQARLAQALQAAEEARADTQRIARRFDLLKGISELALAEEEPAQALEDIVRRLREQLPADCATLLLRAAESDLLRVRASDGVAGIGSEVSVRFGQCLSGRVAAEGRSVVLDDVSAADAAEPLLRAHAGSAAAVPLIKAGQILGVLEVAMRERRHLEPEDVRLLEAVATRLVAVLDRQRSLDAERRARAQAEAAVRQHDEVMAIVAHDLRNSLNRISLSASFLRESLGPDADPRPWELMQRGAKDMDRLIQDLLDVSRMEAGGLQLDRSQLPLAPLLAELQEQFGDLARSRGVELACHADPAVPPVLADRRRLLQALSNLVDNALRLTPAGGSVTIEARPAPGYVEFAVRDTGPGIPAEHLPHLFDRFWQGARARRGGAGLGLAIVKGIVEAHEGRLFAESRPGEGALFRFWIPAPVPHRAAENSGSPASSPPDLRNGVS
jgi:signal transduction histidine kinase